MNPGDDDGDDDGGPVDQLPNTGTGVGMIAGSDLSAARASLSIASLLVGGLALGRRRRTAA